MTRPAPRHPAHVQADRPAAPAAPEAAPEPAPPVPRRHWGWRLALFLWLTAFVFLLLYDVLSDLRRLVVRLWRGG